MSSLVRLYPRAWRARYGVEFVALLAERPPSARDVIDIVLGAIDARLAPQVEPRLAPRRARVTDRLAGAAAISGGLLWCLTYLRAGISQPDEDFGLPLLIAVGLMVGSLPGVYLGRYRRAVGLGVAAVGTSVLVVLGGLLEWGPVLLVPGLIILGALGPGALALAATRAGVGARSRWQLLLLTMPLPFVGGLVAAMGFATGPISAPLLVAATLPLGIAWIAIGARISQGRLIEPGATPPTEPGSTIATAGGSA